MLKFIGIGSAFNTAEGNTSAYIKKNGILFLIDCGSANFHFMKESGFLDDVEEIHVYITHTHSDHIGSLGDLILYMYYAKGEIKNRVTVYAVSEIGVDKYLMMNGVALPCYNFEPLDEHGSFSVLGYTMIPMKTSHVPELLSYGLLIENKKGKLAMYTGDTNELSESVNQWFEDGVLEYLYVDTCSQDYDGNVHLSLRTLHNTVKKKYRDSVWCMHLDEKFDKELARSLGFKIAEVEI